MNKQELNILWVEDSYSDIMLINYALKESNFNHHVSFVNDGVEAIDYLFKQGKYLNTSTPDIIILDLNIPKKSGREVLEEIKRHNSLRQIPVIIFSTSSNKSDILKAYDLNANSYLIKPDNYDELVLQMQSLDNFWLSTVRLPMASKNN